ncbi:MAG: sugar phosphate nucleotidyltransferase, partial [Patescibacteria group bacterium]|nr:sugar phosphate nucleotidyltransferase [Patescibacteria group bacterium]
RDVGPAVGLLAGILSREFPDEPMAILWSDHLVKNEALFRKILSAAGQFIEKHPEKIVFIAQKPRFASENLGWIEYGKVQTFERGIKFHALINFQYRPDKATAERYFASGHHAWNLGYFVTTPKFLWGLYRLYAPNLFRDLGRIVDVWQTARFSDVFHEIYPTVEKIHFDNAILEKLDPSSGLVISENIEWSDIGAWEALKEALQETKDQNVTKGKVLLTDTKDSLVYNFTDQMVVTIDLDDFLVVNTHDVLLVCRKTSVPKIKKLVENLAGTEHDKLT